MSYPGKQEWFERLVENSYEFDIALEEFLSWLETHDGQVAFQDFREEVLKAGGVDYKNSESLDLERFKVFFEWVVDESNHALRFEQYYVDKNGDYGGQYED